MKRIVISNNCLASCIYRDIINIPQPTPFVWNVIQQDDFIKLIKNFDSINFLNFEVDFDTVAQEYYILIDGLVKVYYTHYKYKEDAEEKYTGFEPGHGYMTYTNKVIEYTTEEYIKRVNRLLKAKEEGAEFIFFYDSGCFQSWVERIDTYLNRKHKEISALVKINTKHKIVVSHWEDDYTINLEHNDNVVFILKLYDVNMDLLNMFKDALIEFFSTDIKECGENLVEINGIKYNHREEKKSKLINEDTETKEILA